MKLREWARKQGINYKTAWKWYKEGKLPVPVYQTPTDTILVKVGEEKEGGKTAIYARVSRADQKPDLDRQVARLLEFANSKGLAVAKTVTEIGSGLRGIQVRSPGGFEGFREGLQNLLREESTLPKSLRKRGSMTASG